MFMIDYKKRRLSLKKFFLGIIYEKVEVHFCKNGNKSKIRGS